MREYTEEELNQIVEDYHHGMRPFEIAHKYNRNSGSIINKLKSIGVYTDSRNNLSRSEKDHILSLYADGRMNDILEKYPKMSRENICSLASRSGVRYNCNKDSWSEEDILFLKDKYFDYDSVQLERIFEYRHSRSDILKKARNEFGYEKNVVKWSADEDRILSKYYPTIPIEQVQEMLPKRTLNAIRVRAQKLGITSFFYHTTYWSDDENAFFENHWETMTDAQLAEVLRKDIRAVKDKRWRMGYLHFPKDNRTYDDINKYLRGNAWKWKMDSIKDCHGECVFTGSKDFEIHHQYNVGRILMDIFNGNNSIEYKNISDYTEQELQLMKKLFTDELNKHPLGVCVRKDIHSLFHNIYGKYNDEAQWDEFSKDIHAGKYNTVLNI